MTVPSERDAQPDVQRYSRHVLLPEIGLAGQRRLADARVLVVGAGGLAAPVLSYLAAAGVGRLTVVDDDAIDLSNLQRQVIHRTSDVGSAKVDSAVRVINELNPEVAAVGVRQRLGADNAVTLFADQDVIVDATDNFPTRYLINDACVLLGLPLVWGSIHRFDGQMTIWGLAESPCYRCVFPVPPPDGSVPSCAEAGVVGALPGVIGSLQAMEVIKLLTGVGEPVAGRLLLYDALAAQWSSVPISRDAQCPTCGEASPEVPELAPSLRDAEPAAAVRHIGAADLARALRAGDPPLLVDVRTAAEREIATLPGAVHLPIERLRAGRAGELTEGLPRFDERTVFYCKAGSRSDEAARLVAAATGIAPLSLDGGILAWAREVDPAMPRY